MTNKWNWLMGNTQHFFHSMTSVLVRRGKKTQNLIEYSALNVRRVRMRLKKCYVFNWLMLLMLLLQNPNLSFEMMTKNANKWIYYVERDRIDAISTHIILLHEAHKRVLKRQTLIRIYWPKPYWNVRPMEIVCLQSLHIPRYCVVTYG